MSVLLSYLPLLAGIGMFLYGMDMMAKAIERLAGAKLEQTLETLTSNKWKGLLLGTGVTAVIQSSAATTVTVVGFVNAGMMKLAQALPVVFGANIGSTATAQILRLGDLQGGGVILSLLKPSTFAPVLIVLGAAINLVSKKRKQKNIAQLLMGFGILFFGMTTMEETLSPLRDLPAFQSIFTAFENPVLGILAGLGLTALIQSSSASVGILQALSTTGSVTFATCFPMLMGINIGKCLTVILASFGTNKNSKRTVTVHLIFNVFGAIFFTIVVYGLNMALHFPFMHSVLNRGNIADLHTAFNAATALILMFFIPLLVKIAEKIIPEKGESKENQALDLLDEHFLKNPSLAMEQCRKVLSAMGIALQENLSIVEECISHYDDKKIARLEENEHFLDKCETSVGEYLVKTTHHTMTEDESAQATELLQAVSDLERIGDYCVNIANTATYMHENGVTFTALGRRDANLVFSAITNILNQTIEAFNTDDISVCSTVEALKEVIDELLDTLREDHVRRLQLGICNVSSGISFITLLNNTERIAGHCSNIAIYTVQRQRAYDNFDRHIYKKELHKGNDPVYAKSMEKYTEQYLTPLTSREDWKNRQALAEQMKRPVVQVLDETPEEWKEAVKISLRQLIRNDSVMPGYCNAVIENIEKMGGYFTTSSNAIVIYAKPEEGALGNQIGLTLFKHPVTFPGSADAPVRLCVAMSAVDTPTRNQLLSVIARVMSDKEFVHGFLRCEDERSLKDLLHGALERVMTEEM